MRVTSLHLPKQSRARSPTRRSSTWSRVGTRYTGSAVVVAFIARLLSGTLDSVIPQPPQLLAEPQQQPRLLDHQRVEPRLAALPALLPRELVAAAVGPRLEARSVHRSLLRSGPTYSLSCQPSGWPPRIFQTSTATVSPR